MIADLKPYPEYKASGQESLGEVPKHWDLKPGHSAFKKRKLSNVGLKENTVLSLSYGRIKVKPTDKQHGLVPESYETYQIVDEGNIIIRGTDLLRTQPYIANIICRSTGLRASRLRLYPEEFFRLPIILPPVEEQEAIIKWVTTETEAFTTAIARYEREITLLREYRTRLTADVVTGKLDVRAAAAQLPDSPPDEPLATPDLSEEAKAMKTTGVYLISGCAVPPE